MPKWKKDATEFTVNVNRVGKDVRATLPKPLDNYFGKPKVITFQIKKNGSVVVLTGKKKQKEDGTTQDLKS